MKLIRTEDAAGLMLMHDITQIIPGRVKGPVFKKGHIVEEKDIKVLLSVGKEHLYVCEKDDDMLHEDDAAAILRDICINENMTASAPSEGKIEISSDIDGLFKLDRKKLGAVNSLGRMMIATIAADRPVKKGDKLAGMRVIPLVIEKEAMETARFVSAGGPILSIFPFKHKNVGIVTTGSEVFKGLIEDKFGPAIREKLAEYDTYVLSQRIVDDKTEEITKAIRGFADEGADMILCTGGMSVDPDDVTPAAIKKSGADIVAYGAPVLPGAMFLMAYLKHKEKRLPVMGIPGCVMYAKRTIFDLILPRVLADDEITKEDIDAMGEGGMCLNCDVCTFPKCGFGR